MQQVGPQQVAQLARAMGVRESRLEARARAGSGHQRGHLEGMVAAYGTIASGGLYRAPTVITRIETRTASVEAFQSAARARWARLPHTQLRDERCAAPWTRAPGVAIRARYGITQTWPARPAPRRTTPTAGSS